MRVLVSVKRVVDHSIKIRVKSDGSGLDFANVKMGVNPFDEISLEAAVRLKEAGKVTEVVAVSIGPLQCQEVLRHAMAMGVDRAIHVELPADISNALDPLNVARLIKAIADREKPDLMLFGKQAIDDDCSQTGQMVAALFDMPQATCASKIEINAGNVVVTREIDGGLETVSLSMPAVITSDLRLNEPRFLSLPAIMRAKKKAVELVKLEELGVQMRPRTKLLRVTEPPSRRGGCKVPDVATLIEKLRHEAKVL